MRHKRTTELRYPGLWRGCVGAWAPCLGPTGVMLRDWSGFKTHATLTNGPIFTPSAGTYAVSCDGVDDKCITSNNVPVVTGPQWVSLWFNAAGITVANRPSLFSIALPSSPFTTQLIVGFNVVGTGTTEGTSRLCVIDYDGVAVSGAFTTTTFGSRLNEWFHVVGGWDGTRWFVYINGVDETNAQGTQDAPTAVAAPLYISGTASGRSFNGYIDGIMWSRGRITTQQIRLLGSRRGIAYETAPRRRVSSAVQFNRRRRLLVGAGL